MAKKTTGIQQPNPADQALSGNTQQPLQTKPLKRSYGPTGGRRPFSIPTVNKRYGGCNDLEMFYPDLYQELEEKQAEESE